MSVVKYVPTGLKYVKMGGPPEDWAQLVVMNVDTRELVFATYEININEGWILQGTTTVPEDNVMKAPRRVYGNFEIMRIVEIESTEYATKTEEDSTG